MTDRLIIEDDKEKELQTDLEQVRWPVKFGDVTVRIRNGKPTLSEIHLTIKHD